MTEREAKAFLNNLKVCIEEHPIVADWLVEIADRKTENSSENPNNCEHITEDGVTCAKYPACDDCLDNPLNKLKGSERLVKGSEQTEPQTCEDCIWNVCNYNKVFEDEPRAERSNDAE